MFHAANIESVRPGDDYEVQVGNGSDAKDVLAEYRNYERMKHMLEGSRGPRWPRRSHLRFNDDDRVTNTRLY